MRRTYQDSDVGIASKESLKMMSVLHVKPVAIGWSLKYAIKVKHKKPMQLIDGTGRPRGRNILRCVRMLDTFHATYSNFMRRNDRPLRFGSKRITDLPRIHPTAI